MPRYRIMNYKITASIVTYKTDLYMLKRAIDSFLIKDMQIKLYLIDNSPTDEIRKIYNDERIEYIFNNANIGYGAGHNIAICKSLNISKYHLILNPDIYFEEGTLQQLYEFMEQKPEIGLVMPKVLYPNGSIQFLCKLLPTPFNLIIRRFIPIFSNKINNIFELRFANYGNIMDVPYLSGCFMFIRTDALKRAGFFDERYFMYLEDTDLSRRIHKFYRVVYYPEAFVYHRHEKGSYRDWRLLKCHIISAIKYFNKWGWFFDKERRKINRQVVKELKLKSASKVK